MPENHHDFVFVWRAVASRFVRPSDGLQRAHASLLAANDPDAFRPAFRAGLPTSIDELVWEHPLLLAIDSLPIEPRVQRHSIIADRRKTPRTDGGDGLVPYASAHHPGATSEFVVSAGHVCLENAGVIGEVARILKEHATHQDLAVRGSGADARSSETCKPRPRAQAAGESAVLRGARRSEHGSSWSSSGRPRQ